MRIELVPWSLLRLVELDYDARSYIRLPHIEVLEISKLLDRDAFYTGNDPEVQASSATIDPGTRWRASTVISLNHHSKRRIAPRRILATMA